MDATTPPTDPAPRARRARAGAPPPKKAAMWPWMVVGVVVLGGVAGAVHFLSDTAVHHERPLVIPESAPTGEPLKVDYAVKPGDVFVSTVISKTRFLNSAEEELDTKQGMSFDVKMTLGQGVQKADGPRASTLVRLFVERADAAYGPMSELVWMVLGKRENPYVITFRLDPLGRPDRSTIPPPDAPTKVKRQMVDVVFAGLGDLSTNFLPAREVRKGEVWDLDEVGDMKGGIENLVRESAQRNTTRDGFPPMTLVTKVQAEGFETKPWAPPRYTEPPPGEKPEAPTETHEPEPCVKLRLFVTATMEGATNEAKFGPGFISTAARVSGPIWVSRSTGVVWSVDLTGEIVASYRTSKHPLEIKATIRIVSSTVRAKKMPV